MEKDNDPKVYKGIYISNERKKRPGGRIKCQLFDNKIEIYGKNSAIHETEVQWVEIRRYKKVDRGKRNNPRQNKPTNNTNKNIDKKQESKKEQSKNPEKSERKDNSPMGQDKPVEKAT